MAGYGCIYLQMEEFNFKEFVVQYCGSWHVFNPIYPRGGGVLAPPPPAKFYCIYLQNNWFEGPNFFLQIKANNLTLFLKIASIWPFFKLANFLATTQKTRYLSQFWEEEPHFLHYSFMDIYEGGGGAIHPSPPQPSLMCWYLTRLIGLMQWFVIKWAGSNTLKGMYLYW